MPGWCSEVVLGLELSSPEFADKNCFFDTIRKTSTVDGEEVGAIAVVIMRELSASNGSQRSPCILRPQVVGEDVSDEKEGGLVHERKCLENESKSPRDVAVKGAKWPAPTSPRVATFRVCDHTSFEGPLGEYCKDGDGEGSRKTAENDCGGCGGS